MIFITLFSFFGLKTGIRIGTGPSFKITSYGPLEAGGSLRVYLCLDDGFSCVNSELGEAKVVPYASPFCAIEDIR